MYSALYSQNDALMVSSLIRMFEGYGANASTAIIHQSPQERLPQKLINEDIRSKPPTILNQDHAYGNSFESCGVSINQPIPREFRQNKVQHGLPELHMPDTFPSSSYHSEARGSMFYFNKQRKVCQSKTRKSVQDKIRFFEKCKGYAAVIGEDFSEVFNSFNNHQF